MREELPVVRALLERQRHHPLLEGFPTAARIDNLPLFLGEAGAAQVRWKKVLTFTTIDTKSYTRTQRSWRRTISRRSWRWAPATSLRR